MADVEPEDYPKLPCRVEGCRFTETDTERCGLRKVGVTVEQGLELWADGDPVVRGCFAHQAAEFILAEGLLEEAPDA